MTYAALLPVLAWTCFAGPQDAITVDGVPASEASHLAAIRLEAQPASPFPGQSVELSVIVDLDESLVDGSLLRLFRRELDLELQLRFPGRKGWDPKPEEDGGLRYALDDSVARLQAEALGGPAVDSSPNGETPVPTRFRSTWTRRFDAPGEFTIPGPLLRFAYTTGFRADLLAGSVPTDRKEAYVQAAPFALVIQSFPEEGRPPEFRGDLGHFALEAVPAPAELQVGIPFRLAVLVRPLGDDPAPVPPFPRAPDLRVLGTESHLQGDSRLVMWTAEPLQPGALRIPPVVLATYDPGPAGGFVLTETEAATRIVLEAEPVPEGVLASELPEDMEDRDLVWVVLAALGIGALWFWRTRRSRGRHSAPVPSVELTESTAFDSLLAAVATRLQCPPSAVSGPDLAQRLAAAGVEPIAAEQAAEHYHALEGERFGGPTVPIHQAEFDALLASLL